MNKTTALGAIAISILAFAACSDDEGEERETPMGTAGTGNMGAAGNSATAGSTGMDTMPAPTPSTLTYGDAFTVDGGNVVGTAEAILGNVFPVANGLNGDGYVGDAPPDPTASHVATFEATGDRICMSGTIKEVPVVDGAGNYTNHWGVQVGMNLNVPAAEGETPDTEAAPAADADAGAPAADAGVIIEAPDSGAVDAPQADPEPWEAGDVIGFSFTINAQNGTPLPSAMRFLGAPSDPDLSAPGVNAPGDLNFCSPILPFDGSNVDVLFSDIVDRCWGETPRADFEAPLTSVGWQVPSDPGAANNYDYDFCIEDIRAIVQ